MRTESNVNTSIVDVKKLPGSLEQFTFTLNKGQLKAQELEALLEFNFLCRPYQGLRVVHNMLMVYLMSHELEEIEPKDVDALREILNLFTNLWGAQKEDYDPVDLKFF